MLRPDMNMTALAALLEENYELPPDMRFTTGSTVTLIFVTGQMVRPRRVRILGLLRYCTPLF
jgi:hypothetical protein